MEQKFGQEYVNAFRASECWRQKQIRSNMTPEQKQRCREKAKIRQQRYQERKKAKQKRVTRSSAAENIEDVEKKREYWRRKQKEARERRRQKKIEAEKKNINKEDSGDSDSDNTEGVIDVDTDYGTVFENSQAKKQAMYRVNKKLPAKDSAKWAEIMTGLIHSASPTKKVNLESKGVCTIPPEDLEYNRQIMDRIDKMNQETRFKRDRYSLMKQRVLAEIIMGHDVAESDVEVSDVRQSPSEDIADDGELFS